MPARIGGLPTGGASFGKPVYSIGHGFVTYAEPLGWNVDQGVLIVQHTLANGRTILSFYGHLDPLSIVLTPGECVVRGQQVGQIGRPRGSPHLHFEIRTQSPYQPLTGYWPEDPTVRGWLPPSQTIWEQRMSSSAGVQWTRPFVDDGTKGIGVINGDTLLAIEDAELVGISLVDGGLRWRYEEAGRLSNAALDATGTVLYTAGSDGHLGALSLLDGLGAVSSMPALTALWERDLHVLGTPVLLPLPQGGVVVSLRQQLFGVAADGTLAWQGNNFGQLFAWQPAGDSLLLSMNGGDTALWQATGGGLEAWTAPGNGYLALAGEQGWLHAADGLYRLDSDSRTAELLYPLARGGLSLGHMLALADGGILLAHSDAADRRLLAFAPDGSLRWERSYRGLVAGQVRLVGLDGAVYLVAQEAGGSAAEVKVYSVNLGTAELTHLFTGGTRTALPADSWTLAAGRQLLINIGGGHLVSFAPHLAAPPPVP